MGFLVVARVVAGFSVVHPEAETGTAEVRSGGRFCFRQRKGYLLFDDRSSPEREGYGDWSELCVGSARFLFGKGQL